MRRIRICFQKTCKGGSKSRSESCVVTLRRRPRAIVDPNTKIGNVNVIHVLKQVLAKYERNFHVTANTREKYYLETKTASLNGRPLFFASVLRGKEYVSLHLMPLYWEPALARGISAGVKKHMEGKTTFRYTQAPEPSEFRELRKMAGRAFNFYRRKNLL